MTIPAQIQEILGSRRQQLPRLDGDIRDAIRLLEVVRELESSRDHIASLLPSRSIEKIASLARDCAAALAQLTSLRERFSRPYLTLMSFGRARQGKSRKLQTLTGLSDAELPTGRLGHCTGATIEVRHETGSPRAEITTYDESAFLRDRIAPYFRDFGLDDQIPESIDGFLSRPLPEPARAAEFIGASNAESQLHCGRYAELHRIQQALPAFRKHLRGGTKQVSLRALRQWVSHPDSVNGAASDGEDHRCLAVRTARVFVGMPLVECQDVRIFDTSGLDSHSSGDYDALATLLDNEADAALVTRLANSKGDDWMATDSRVLDEIHARMTNGVSLSDIATIVLNEVKQEGEPNRDQCETVRRGAVRYGVDPTRIAIADCSDRDSLHREVVVPLLQRLIRDCPQLDAKRLSRPLSTLREAIRQTRSILDQLAEAARTAAARIDPDEQFLNWLEEGQRALTSGFRQLKVEAGRHREDLDEDFLDDVTRVAAQATDEVSVPSAEEIADFILTGRHAEIGTALDYYMQKLRCELAHMFGQLRNDLGRSVIEHWRCENLRVVEQTGITRLVEHGPAAAVFSRLADLTDRSGGITQLASAFRMLAEFRIHFPHFLATIWKVLEQFEPNEYIGDLGKGGEVGSGKSASDLAAVPRTMCDRASKLLAKLKRDAIKAIVKELSKVAALPSELSWALVCDVHDRIIIADGVATEWKQFLRPFRQRLMSRHDPQQVAERDRLLDIERLADELLNRLTAIRVTGTDVDAAAA